MTPPPKFTHLHVHSEYSLLDGANRIALTEHHKKEKGGRVGSLLSQVAAHGMRSVALTDHGNMCGAIEFYREARSLGLKAILGMEAYVAPGSRFDKAARLGEESHHLTLLAKDERGYRNLLALASLGHEEGFHYRPRIDKELLQARQEGLIVLSGCLAAEVPELLLKGKHEEAERVAGWFKELLGPDRYFLELMDHGMKEQVQVNRALVELGGRLGLGLVASNDAHYLTRADSLAHEVLLCIQTGKTLADASRMRFGANEFYVKSPAEMAERFKELPGALTASWEIGERCGLELTFADDKGGRLHFPPFPVPAEFASAEEFLRHQCMEGVKRRYGSPRGTVMKRLDHELGVIGKKGFTTYFLIVGDIVRHAKASGILVGPGRGSSAGSLVAYVLGITDLDPLKYDLIFERFLNEGREEPPDIDIDFPDDRREEVVNYIRETFGRENVAQIVTFARMNARAAVRDVGRVLGLPYGDMDRFSKMLVIPNTLNPPLLACLQLEPVKAAIKEREEYGKVADISLTLESLARHASKHAAGVVIAPPAPGGGAAGLRAHVPLLRLEENVHVTQFDMDGIKHLGLLKIDVLGLKTLTVLEQTRQLLKRTQGRDLDYHALPLDDAPTYALFAEGKTDGIFQFESSGMRDALRKLKPDHLEDLIALNALYRPGPMEQIDNYIRRRRGLDPATVEVPELEPILKATYGIIVYQEQVIQIAHTLAGYSMTKADEFRRSMGKKKADIMAREEENFIAGAVKNRIPKEKAERIYDFLEKFAGYGFNRSHSACYALVAYWTAYLKVHYPFEFMAALLTSETGNHDKIAEYAGECRKLKVPLLGPDVNLSQVHFAVESREGGSGGELPRQSIRFGLAAVKNAGEAAMGAVVRAREAGGPFRSLDDFCERAEGQAVNKKVMESLVKCGAFDALGPRDRLLAALPKALERGSTRQADRARGQESLFGNGAAAAAPDVPLPPADDTLSKNYLAFEKELLGCYVTGHPLADYEDEIRQFSTQSLKPDRLNETGGGKTVKVAGIITRLKHGLTKKKEPFARLTLEDLEGAVEMLAWPEIMRKCGQHVANGAIVMVTGRLQKEEDGRFTLIVGELMPLAEAQVRLTKGVHLAINTVGTDERTLRSVAQVASLSPGEAALYLHLKTLHHGEAVLEANPSLRVKPTRELLTQLRALLGDDAVSLSDRLYTPNGG